MWADGRDGGRENIEMGGKEQDEPAETNRVQNMRGMG